MDRATQRAYANQFRSLHHADDPLILVNAWDVASARAISASLPAIATSSAGVASARGYADGEEIPLDIVIRLVESISAAVAVPLSVDFEAGYGDEPEAVGDAIAAIIGAGAVGVNLEDGLTLHERRLVDPGVHAAKISAARRAADTSGIPLFINARTDPFWLTIGTPEECMTEALQRAAMYTDAGADGVFVPRLLDLKLIEAFVGATTLPINILAMPGGPSIRELQTAGVKRISLGSWPMRATMQHIERAAATIASDMAMDALL